MTTPTDTTSSSGTPSRHDRAHAWVDAAYETVRRADPDFVVRSAQVKLSKDVATAFIDGHPFTAEAPTGTGKTLAYLLGALAATHSSGLNTKEPVVVSTATKALQQQLFDKDLPKLVRAGLLRMDEVAIAKGKGNYLCVKSAEEISSLLFRAGDDPELFLDAGSEQLMPEDVTRMLDAFEAGRWNGDFDHYEGVPPRTVRPIAVNGDTCTRKKCPHFSRCAYYKARNAMAGVQVLVANHDLVLRDLLLVAEGLEPTLPVANYLVVFDEAHHLPEKAIAVGSADAALTSLMNALPKVAGVQRIISGNSVLMSLAKAKHLKPESFDRGPVGTPLRELIELLATLEVDEESGQRRFPKGAVPADVQAAIRKAQTPLSQLLADLGALTDIIREAHSLLDKGTEEKANEVIRRALDVKTLGDAAVRCFTRLLSTETYAKWLFRKDSTVSLHTAPLEGAQVLRPLLWDSERVNATVMVSATLRDIGGFSRFVKRSGLPHTGKFSVLPYTFPYKESRLVVAPMAATPKLAERKQFLAELAVKLPAALNPREGTLIIFPSWAMLREFGPKLKARFGERKVRVQGESTVKMLVRDHCADIDRGEGAILAGVATLAEGLDLPGKYCTHVAIVSLPFAVPTDPVEQELSDQLGNKYFGERALPDAMVRLTQMVGRLLRRESDRGRVTLFDRRLATTSYGRQMLNALPPFEKVIEPLTPA